jgi:hypothetical protein
MYLGEENPDAISDISKKYPVLTELTLNNLRLRKYERQPSGQILARIALDMSGSSMTGNSKFVMFHHQTSPYTWKNAAYDILKKMSLQPWTALDVSWLEASYNERGTAASKLLGTAPPPEAYYSGYVLRLKPVSDNETFPVLKRRYFDTLIRKSSSGTISEYLDYLRLYKSAGIVLQKPSDTGTLLAKTWDFGFPSGGPASKSDYEALKKWTLDTLRNPLPTGYQNIVPWGRANPFIPVNTAIFPYPVYGVGDQATTTPNNDADRLLYTQAIIRLQQMMVADLANRQAISSLQWGSSLYGSVYAVYSNFLNYIREFYPSARIEDTITVQTPAGNPIYWIARLPVDFEEGPAIDFGIPASFPAYVGVHSDGTVVPILEAENFDAVLPVQQAVVRMWRQAIEANRIPQNLVELEAKLYAMTRPGYIPTAEELDWRKNPALYPDTKEINDRFLIIRKDADIPGGDTNLPEGQYEWGDPETAGISYQGLLHAPEVRAGAFVRTTLSEGRTGREPPGTTPEKPNYLLWALGGAAAAYATYKASGG